MIPIVLIYMDLEQPKSLLLIYTLTFLLRFQGETNQYFLLVFCLQQITRPSQEDKSDDKTEEDKSEKSEKKEDEEKKDEEEKDEKEESRWVVNSCLSWCHSHLLALGP